MFEGRAGAVVTEGMRLRTTFEVLRTFKGDAPRFVEVLTMSSSAACGRKYQPGETYLVYAAQANGGLSDNLCSRTRRSIHAADDLAVLGTGVEPGKVDAASEAGPGNVEPPRIEHPPEAPPAVTPERRGCAASIAGQDPGPATALLMLLGVASLRRRAYRGDGSSLQRRKHVARIVRDPTARQ